MDQENNPNYSGAERRQYPRIKGDMAAYAFYPSGPFKEPAFIKDLSIGGACLFISEHLGVDAILYLKIYILGRDVAISAKSKVVWRSKADGPSTYYIGVQFLEVLPAEKEQLSQYIAQQLKDGAAVKE